MAVTTGTITSASMHSGLTLTFAATIVAANTRLLVFVGNDSNTAQTPTGVTCNSVAMTMAGQYDFAGLVMDGSWWYLNNPTTGSPSIVVTVPNSSTATGAVAIPISGADLTQVPVVGSGTNVNPSTTITCAIAGAGANDMYFGGALVRSTSLTSAGAPQVNLAAIPAINGLDSVSADRIPGTSTGNFSWTLGSSNYGVAVGALVKGLAGVTYITKWTPFRWACAMRSLQQGANNVGNRQQNRLALLASAITNANGAATWAKWRVGENSRVSSCGLVLNVPLVPGFVPPVGTVDDGT